jgi:hypothetical protein
MVFLTGSFRSIHYQEKPAGSTISMKSETGVLKAYYNKTIRTLSIGFVHFFLCFYMLGKWLSHAYQTYCLVLAICYCWVCLRSKP